MSADLAGTGRGRDGRERLLELRAGAILCDVPQERHRHQSRQLAHRCGTRLIDHRTLAVRPLDRQRKEPLVATLDPVSNLVVVEGCSATDYLIPAIGREGNYHSREIWFYRDSMHENMVFRARLHARKTGTPRNEKA